MPEEPKLPTPRPTGSRSIRAANYYDEALLSRGVGIKFNGQEKTNVIEYCVSEGWIRVAAGRSRDRFGQPMTLKLQGQVEPYFEDVAQAEAAIRAECSGARSFDRKLLVADLSPCGDFGEACRTRSLLEAALLAVDGDLADRWHASAPARCRRLVSIIDATCAVGNLFCISRGLREFGHASESAGRHALSAPSTPEQLVIWPVASLALLASALLGGDDGNRRSPARASIWR